MAGDERSLQNELKQLWESHVIVGIMGNQTLEYASDALSKVLCFGLLYYLKIMETVYVYLNDEE